MEILRVRRLGFVVIGAICTLAVLSSGNVSIFFVVAYLAALLTFSAALAKRDASIGMIADFAIICVLMYFLFGVAVGVLGALMGWSEVEVSEMPLALLGFAFSIALFSPVPFVIVLLGVWIGRNGFGRFLLERVGL